jgi:competence protein ComEA
MAVANFELKQYRIGMRVLGVLLLALNLNTATPKQLEALPGIGPVLANRIVEFRDKKGGYKRIEELLAIPGVSEKKWKVLRQYLTVP